MSDPFWPTDAQRASPERCFPKSHGKPGVDDRRVLFGRVFIGRNGLRRCDAPGEHGPHETLYTRWRRWSERGVFARIPVGPAADEPEKKFVMFDAMYLKTRRAAAGVTVKGAGTRSDPRSQDAVRKGRAKGPVAGGAGPRRPEPPPRRARRKSTASARS